MYKRGELLPLVLIVGLFLALLAIPTLAQEGIPQPVDASGNTLGEVNLTAPTARYLVPSAGNESALLSVFGISNGLVPRFRVLDTTGNVVLDVGNAEGLATANGTALFSAPGVYTIEIEGANGTSGQFMLNLQPGAPPPPPVALTPGQQVPGTVGSQSPVIIYEFSGNGLPHTLTVMSLLTDIGPVVSLRDETAGRVIATSDGTLLGQVHFLASANNVYRVEVQAGSRDVPFTICLDCPLPGSTAATTVPGDAGIVTPTAGACTIASNVGGNVNVRVGPGTDYVIVSALLAGQTYPVTGQLAGGGWYQVNVNGLIGWVGASVTLLQGDCANIPLAQPPAGAPRIPTAIPTASLTPATNATATATLNLTVTATATTNLTATATATTDLTATATPTWTATDASPSTPTAPSTEIPPPVTTEEP